MASALSSIKWGRRWLLSVSNSLGIYIIYIRYIIYQGYIYIHDLKPPKLASDTDTLMLDEF